MRNERNLLKDIIVELEGELRIAIYTIKKYLREQDMTEGDDTLLVRMGYEITEEVLNDNRRMRGDKDWTA